MISIKQWMELVKYRITEGSEYGWQCFGPNAYRLDSWDGDNENGWSVEVIFDTVDQTVYQVEVHDYKHERAYRFTNPAFNDAYVAAEKGHAAFDSVDYKVTNLELEDDWAVKAEAIIDYQEYDTGILVPLDFSDEELLPIFKLAHAANMSFNDYVCMMLREFIEKQHPDAVV